MPDWQVPGYTGLKRIGSGGFGEVQLARHDASGALVAIKYLRQDLLADADSAEMFRNEATVLASLDDPNIVRLYEYIESPSGAAIVMELVGGVSLREILTYQGKTTPEAALVVLQGSLLGLATAHRRGIVHRDYKPENVLVNGDGVSKLTDFGIAARSGGFAVPAGTLRYAAPEQMAGAVSTPAGDIYAATATFYECLTGRPPFRGEADDLLDRHRTEPVPLDQVPEQLRPLVAAGMAKEPGGRPTDATAFVNDLNTVASTVYGRSWQEHGRSHLSEAALLLAALWPSGAPPTVQGASVYRVPLRRRPRLWHAAPAKAGIAVGVAAAAAAAGTAWAVAGGLRTSASEHPVAAVQSVSLKPSPGPTPSTGTLPSPTQTASPGDTTSGAGTGAPTPVGPTTHSVSAPPTTHAVSPPPTTHTVSPPPTTHSVAPPPTTNTATSPPPVPPTVPAVPSVTAAANGSYQITVQWTDSSPGITGFYIDNGCPAGACGQADVEEYKTLGVVYSTTFAATPGDYECYHVAAISSAGESALSSWACLTTPGLNLAGSTQWLDTGVSLSAGDGVGIRASGTITVVAGGNLLGPDGESCAVDTNRADRQAPCYSLIGRIGNGDPFEIGSAAQLAGVSGGELYIGVNDDNFGDNTGSWSVRIKKGGSLPP